MKKLLFMMYVLINVMVYSERIKVTFISPNSSADPFWDKVSSYMKVTADQLDIDLRVLHPQNSYRFEALKILQNEINSENKPDYLVYLYPAYIGEKMLNIAEENKIYTFLFNANIPLSDKDIIKKVGEKYRYWAGHIYPDDNYAGYHLAKDLIEEAKKKKISGEDEMIHVVALTGSRDSNVSEDRNAGLMDAVLEAENVVVDQVLYTYWDVEKAEQMIPTLFHRFTDVSVIWAASDAIALGALKSAREIGKTLGEDFLIGGIDWTEAGIQSVKNDEMLMTIGGHFLEGVSTLLLIKNHSMGYALSNDSYPIKTKMGIIDRENVESFHEFLKTGELDKKKLEKMLEVYRDVSLINNTNLIESLK